MAGTATLRVCVIGELRAQRGAVVLHGPQLGSRKARTVLAMLALAGRPGSDANRLADVLWPAGPPRSSANVVASLISRLRRAFGPDIVVGGRSHYRLGSGVEVDLEVAADLVAHARRHSAEQPALTLAAAHSALELLSAGAVLPDEPDTHWIHDARTRHESLQRAARHLVIRAALQTGDPHTAMHIASLARAADPLDENAASGLMRALAATGDSPAALAAFARLRAELAEHLGADPSPTTQRLHVAILRGESTTEARGERRGVLRHRPIARAPRQWRGSTTTAHSRGPRSRPRDRAR